MQEKPSPKPGIRTTNQRKQIGIKQLHEQIWDAYVEAHTAETVTKIYSSYRKGVAPPVERQADPNPRHCAVPASRGSSPQTLRNALKVTARKSVSVCECTDLASLPSRARRLGRGMPRGKGAVGVTGSPKQPPSPPGPPPRPTDSAGLQVITRRTSSPPIPSQGSHRVHASQGIPHRLATDSVGRPRPSPPHIFSQPSPHPFLPASLPFRPPRPRGLVPFPLPPAPPPPGGPVSHPQPSPRYATHPTAPASARRIGPPPQVAPPARGRGARNKARGAAGPGAAAMLAGAVNKGERPEAPARGPAGRGRCTGATRCPDNAPWPAAPRAPPPLSEPAAPPLATPAPLRHTALPVGH